MILTCLFLYIGLVDTNIEYQSIHNYPSTQHNNNNNNPQHQHKKLSLDSEEGYETIPPAPTTRTTSSYHQSNQQHHISYLDTPSPDGRRPATTSPDGRPGSSRSAGAGGLPLVPAAGGGQRMGPPLPEPARSPGLVSFSLVFSPHSA